MKYCTKCGLPETYPGIRFDEEGVCNFCNFYDEHRDTLEDQESRHRIFLEEVEQAKQRAKETNAPYDCVVGLSGGKDSTYIVWQMKKTYGLRVLAVTFQNGFHTDYGRRNIDNVLQKLDVDHITVRMNEKELRRYYSKCVGVMKNFCAVCFHFGFYYCHQVAERYGIPLVINGRTKGQIMQFAVNTRGIEPFEISRGLKDFEYQMFGDLIELLDRRGKVDYLPQAKVTSLSYFAYHDITEEETMEFLVKEIGWERPDSKVPHADCWAHAMAEHLSIVKRGYPVRTGELAVLVRRGELTKEEASAILKDDKKRYKKIDRQLEGRFYNRISVSKSVQA
ncbi:7-cyano-7-deazaguanine synthase [Blautia schinkii]|nr:7-cyano-7-deazaguanine synthase [Blautia schinkii]